MLITGSAGGNTFRFSALTKELRNQGMEKAVTIYSLDARFDAVIDLSRQVGGVDGANLINEMNIYSYSAAGQQDWRIGATEGDLVTLCNKEYAANTTLPQEDLPQPAPPAFARDPYGTVGVDLRGLPDDRTRRSTTPARTSRRRPRSRHSRRFPTSTASSPRAHRRRAPTQIINHPPTKVRVHPRAQQGRVPVRAPVAADRPGQLPDLSDPAARLRQGRQGREGPVLRRQELAPFAAEEHRAGKVVARRELARGTVEADTSLLDEDDAVGDRGGDVQ